MQILIILLSSFIGREKRGSEAKVDYVIELSGQVIPIEIRAGKTGRIRSMKQFMLEKKSLVEVQISQAPLAQDKEILVVPLYMISEIPRLILNL